MDLIRSMIFTTRSTIGDWPDKFQDIVFKNTKASDLSNDMFKTVTFDNS